MTRNLARVVLLCALTTAFVGGVSRAAVDTPAELERAFWLCDYAGTTGPVDVDTAMACSSIYEDLSIRKFKGDLDAVLLWYQQNKAVQYQANAAASH
jgi:hypothetical protein